MNWRRPVILAGHRAAGRAVAPLLRRLEAAGGEPSRRLAELEAAELARLLEHAAAHVPYYRTVLQDVGAVRGGKADLANFGRVPPLTKETIRTEGDALASDDRAERGCFANTTGGSTGEPIRFLQDRDYETWRLACAAYRDRMAGSDIGRRVLLLWGSERDILGQGITPGKRLSRWLLNTRMLNSFRMSAADMDEYVRRWNDFGPEVVRTYTSSILDLARHVRRVGAKVRPPRAIICTAEVLSEDVRRLVQETFGCAVLDEYGSREMGAGACECLERKGLHVFSLNTRLDVLDAQLRPCGPGEIGDLHVTTLHNYSMPLIRYRIGDQAAAGEAGRCACGRAWPRVGRIVGRHVEVFRTRDGRSVPGEFFIHFVGVVFNKGYIRQFQVVQKEYDRVVIRVAVEDEAKFAASTSEMVQAIRRAMGDDCRVEFERVERIDPLPSGKYLYTISEVACDHGTTANG